MSKYEVDASWQTLHDQAYETVQDYMTRAAAYVDKTFGEYTDGGQQSVLLLLFQARVVQLLKGCCGMSVSFCFIFLVCCGWPRQTPGSLDSGTLSVVAPSRV